MPSAPYRIETGSGPVAAAAVHDGHELRPEVAAICKVSDSDRLREEDPYTAAWTDLATTRFTVFRSRFEVDFNRPRDRAVYRLPEDAWGLDLWKTPLGDDLVAESLEIYDAFYNDLYRVLDGLVQRHDRFVLYDLHSYCHRRLGSNTAPEPPEANPEINLGTRRINREYWAPVVEAFLTTLRGYDFRGRHLDVRENVKFGGGHLSAWVQDHFPQRGVALAVEVKKFFMDEWTGKPDPILAPEVGRALAATKPAVMEALSNLK
jgi:N-formylglutamate deformylase